MKNKKLLNEALSTLIDSWGGDTPQEAIWTYNELVEFINAEFNMELKLIENEEHYHETYTENMKLIDPSEEDDEVVDSEENDEVVEKEDPNVGCLVGIETVWWWNFRKDRAEELIESAVQLSEVTIKSRTTKVGWFITKTEIHYWYGKIHKAQDFKTFLDVI